MIVSCGEIVVSPAELYDTVQLYSKTSKEERWVKGTHNLHDNNPTKALGACQ